MEQWLVRFGLDFERMPAPEQISWTLGIATVAVSVAYFGIRQLLAWKRPAAASNAHSSREARLARAVARVLVMRAVEHGAPIDYRMLAADAVNIDSTLAPLRGPDTFDALHLISGKLLDYAQKRSIWLPPTTALIVNDPPNGLPGKGFFSWARSYTLARLTEAERVECLAELEKDSAAATKRLQQETYLHARRLKAALDVLF